MRLTRADVVRHYNQPVSHPAPLFGIISIPSMPHGISPSRERFSSRRGKEGKKGTRHPSLSRFHHHLHRRRSRHLRRRRLCLSRTYVAFLLLIINFTYPVYKRAKWRVIRFRTEITRDCSRKSVGITDSLASVRNDAHASTARRKGTKHIRRAIVSEVIISSGIGISASFG